MTEKRELGIRFGSLQMDLQAEAFPLTHAEFLNKYGEREVEHASGSTSIRELLEPLGDPEFESIDDIEQSILSMVDDGAIGRKYYTDRETSTRGLDSDPESM